MVVFGLNAIAVVVAVALTYRHHSIWSLASTAAGGLVGLVFWRWIALGAAARAERPALPPDDPDAPHRIGPWGYVGVVLLTLMAGAFALVFVLSVVEGRRQDDAVAQVREDAVVVAERDHLTVDQVQGAIAERLVALGADRPDPLADLVDVPGADVLDASVEDGEALVLLRADRGGPPCVILRIAEDGAVDTLESERCS